MVLWSYLLFAHPVDGATLADVLAPVDEAPAPAIVDSDHTDDERAHAPLVAPGADQIDLLTVLERELTAKIQPKGTLRLLPASPLPELPRGGASPTVELIDYPSRLTSSSVLLRFRLDDDGRVLGPYVVTFRVQLMTQVWVPTQRLSPGDELDASAVVAREVDLVREPRAVPADPAIFNRYELARATTPDRPLSWNDLAPRSLVHKGQLVDVIASEGLLSVSMKGQATRSGALGDVVVVRNLESKREFSAEVIDENKVRVHF